jgi:hypothetical protein
MDFLNEYKIAQAVPLERSITYSEIAANVGFDETLIKRFIRFAMTMHIFDETEDGAVKHTSFSRLMATHPFMSDAVNFHTKELSVGASKTVESLRRWGPSQEGNECGFNIALGTDKTLWEVTKHAAGCMRYAMEGDAWHARHILDAFDWALIDKPGARAVDIGGGMGQLPKFLIQHTNHIHFTVQDLPHIVTEALEVCEDGMRPRIIFQAHDFFTPQKMATPPDLFFTRFILHDWSDKFAGQILKGLVPAMGSHTKILIFEAVLPEGPERRESRRTAIEQDIIMHVCGNGRERSAKDFRNLLAGVDKRFVLERINDPPASMLKGVLIGWNPEA